MKEGEREDEEPWLEFESVAPVIQTTTSLVLDWLSCDRRRHVKP